MKPEKIESIYKAYRTLRMADEEMDQYESDVKRGLMPLPQDGSLYESRPQRMKPAVMGAVTPQKAKFGRLFSEALERSEPWAIKKAREAEDMATPMMKPSVLDAYSSGKMSDEEKEQFEEDYDTGMFRVPEGFKFDLEDTGLFSGMTDLVTGSERETVATKRAGDWFDMPEMNRITGNTEGVFNKAKAFAKVMGSKAGTLATGPEESAKILMRRHPDLRMRKDSKGNIIFTSGEDGKEYAIKPGADSYDALRAVTVGMGFGLASSALNAKTALTGSKALLSQMGVAAGVQTGLEAKQKALGGEINPEDVLLAGLSEAVVPGAKKAVQAMSPSSLKSSSEAIKKGYGKIADYVKKAYDAGDTEAAKAVTMSQEEVVDTAIRNLRGTPEGDVFEKVDDLVNLSKKAIEIQGDKGVKDLGKNPYAVKIAQAINMDDELVDVALKTGSIEDMPLIALSSDDAAVQFISSLSSIRGSLVESESKKSIDNLAKVAEKVIRDQGGEVSLASADQAVKSQFWKNHADLDKNVEDIWGKINGLVNPKEDMSYDNVVKYLDDRIKKLRGAEGLEPLEREALKKVYPEVSEVESLIFLPDGSKMPPTKKVDTRSWERVDDFRKKLTLKRVGKDSGLKDGTMRATLALEDALLQDQYDTLQKIGGDALELFKAGRKAVAVRKSLEKDFAEMYGNKFDGSILKTLQPAIQNLSKGDVAAFENLIKKTPKESRQQMLASGLNYAFSKNTANGTLDFANYTKWYESLMKEPKAAKLLFDELPGLKENMESVYKLSKAISEIPKGPDVKPAEMIKNAESLFSSISRSAKEGAVQTASYLGMTKVGLPVLMALRLSQGVGSNKMSTKTLESTLRSMNDIFASPEMFELIRNSTPESVEALAKSSAFTRFWDSFAGRSLTKAKNTMANKERWITNALQGTKSNISDAEYEEEAPDFRSIASDASRATGRKGVNVFEGDGNFYDPLTDTITLTPDVDESTAELISKKASVIDSAWKKAEVDAEFRDQNGERYVEKTNAGEAIKQYTEQMKMVKSLISCMGR